MYVGGGALDAPPDQDIAHMGVIKPGQLRKLSTGTGLDFSKILSPGNEVIPIKKTVYLLESGVLRRQGDALCYEGAGAGEFISVENTSEILIYGEVSFDKPVLDFCTEKQVILLVERKVLTEADFVKTEEGVLLSLRGKEVFLAEWGARMAKPVNQQDSDREITYRQLIKMELIKLERHLVGEDKYASYLQSGGFIVPMSI